MYIYVFKITNICTFLSSIIYPITSTLLYFLPSLCISPSFVVLYWCSVRCIANTFLMVQTWHCIQFDIESVMQKHYREINIYPSAPHHCCLDLHLFHTLSYSSRILSLSRPRFIFKFAFIFLNSYFTSSLAIYLSLPSGLSFHRRKGQKKHFWAIDPWKWKRKSPPMKKEFILQHAGQQQAKGSVFSCCRRHV